MTATVRQTISNAANAFWKELPIELRLSGKLVFYSPILASSAKLGATFPDFDIGLPGIGIGGHRWAVTHSAMAAWLARKGMNVIDRYVSDNLARKAVKEVAAAAGIGFCIGLSSHLLKDAFWDNEQSVRFKIPFIGGPGTILEGTYLDDDLWLGANGLYAAKIATDLFVTGFGEDAQEAVQAFRKWRNQEAAMQEVRKAHEAAVLESR